jgi:AcrR family transcriptional regulator
MESTIPDLDPRIRRTRQLLFQALGELLTEKSFDEISVQDIADRSTINRATFYDHFTDKFALLEAKIAETFRLRFEARMGGTEGNCPIAQKQLVLTLCDFLTEVSTCQKLQKQFGPLVESRVKSVLREYLLHGILKSGFPSAEAELRATMASWAIYGAALEWSRNKLTTPEEMADMVLPLIRPALYC